MKFVAELIAWAAAAAAFGATTLNHEVGNHAMKNETVIKGPLFFLTRFFVREFFCAFGEANKVCDGVRRFFFKQAHDDVALRCLENGVRSCGTSHEISLRWLVDSSYTTIHTHASSRRVSARVARGQRRRSTRYAARRNLRHKSNYG